MNDEKIAEPDTSRVLMSDTLKGLLADDNSLKQIPTYVIVVIDVKDNEGSAMGSIVGSLETIMFQDRDVELEVRISLDDALNIIKLAPDVTVQRSLTFTGFELQPSADDNIRFEPQWGYSVKGARLGAIDHARQLCSILLNLRAN